MLKVTDLKKAFKNKDGTKVEILKKLNIEIKKGEILGIIGESGCGKTTFLRTVLRLEEADSGSVLYNGVDLMKISKNEIRNKIRRNLRYVYQHPEASLNPGVTVGKSLLNTCKLFHTNELEKKVADSLELVGLPFEYKSSFPHELSGGEKRRAVLARALITEPQMIFADEPFSGLDKILQARLIQSFLRIQKQRELTYILVSHDQSIINNISDRIFRLQNGILQQIKS